MTRLRNWLTSIWFVFKRNNTQVPSDGVIGLLSEDSYQVALDEVRKDLEYQRLITKELRFIKFKVLSGESLTIEEEELLKIYD